MSVSSKDYRRGSAPRGSQWSWSDLDWRKVSAAGIFLLGAWLTKDAAAEWLPLWLAYAAAVPIQLLLTHLESPIFRRWQYVATSDRDGEWYKRNITGINWAALLVDGTINAAGAWAFWRVAHEKRLFLNLADMLGNTTQPLRGPLAVLVCFACGILVACGFERLWYDSQYVD